MADTKLFNIKGAVKEYQSGTVTLEKELQTVIENNMNISLAAQKKYVHRNTMMIHARRLWQLLNIDPVHKDNDRFLLMLICTYFRKNHYES